MYSKLICLISDLSLVILTLMFPPGKNNQLLGSTGSKLSTRRVGRSAVLTTRTLSIPQQLLKSGSPSSDIPPHHLLRLVVVIVVVVVVSVVVGCVVGRVSLVAFVYCSVVVVLIVVVGNDVAVVVVVVVGIVAVVVVVVAVLVVVLVVVSVFDICSHFKHTPSALACLGRYTRCTSVKDDGSLG